MDQTVQYATESFLRDELAKATLRIAELDEHSSRVTQRDYSTRGELQAMRDGMHEWTMEELSNGQLTESQAEAIAEICGFELTKEVEVEVSVTYTMTVNVGPNEDVEDIVNDIDFDTVSYNDENISYMSSSVDRIDF